MYNKFKSFLADDAIFTAILLILVGVVSFGLGRQSVAKGGVLGMDSAIKSQVTLIIPQKPVTNSASAVSAKDSLVASKSGSRYHLLTCPGASQIKEENKVYFDSVELAKAAGYTPAANCKFTD